MLRPIYNATWYAYDKLACSNEELIQVTQLVVLSQQVGTGKLNWVRASGLNLAAACKNRASRILGRLWNKDEQNIWSGHANKLREYGEAN